MKILLDINTCTWAYKKVQKQYYTLMAVNLSCIYNSNKQLMKNISMLLLHLMIRILMLTKLQTTQNRNRLIQFHIIELTNTCPDFLHRWGPTGSHPQNIAPSQWNHLLDRSSKCQLIRDSRSASFWEATKRTLYGLMKPKQWIVKKCKSFQVPGF